jgi:hypothetical protein
MESPSGTSGVKDAIVTLPLWGISLLAALCLASLAFAAWLGIFAEEPDLKSDALHLLLVIIPLSSAVVAAIAMRRTSTKEIDALVTAFLDHTLRQRFEAWTSRRAATGAAVLNYPFSQVRLYEPSANRSYAFYMFSDAGRDQLLVGVKSNVFNFEVFATLPLALPAGVAAPSEPLIANSQTLDRVRAHPIISKFIGITQGSVNEGYEVKFAFSPAGDAPSAACDHGPATHEMHISLRQKVRENFLTSPFLKRYFAEDAAIAIRVLFLEWRSSGLAPVLSGAPAA